MQIPVGRNPSESYRVSTAAVLISPEKSCWGARQDRLLQTLVTLAMWLIPAALLFFLVPGQLYSFLLYQSLGGVNSKRVLPVVPQKVGEASCSPFSPFPTNGNFFWLGSAQMVMS